MTKWLIRTFVKDADRVGDPRVRTRYGQFAGIVCIVCNIALCAAKGLVGLAVGSISIVADAVNNLSDASSNIISLLGFKLADKPADDKHPYGHGRFEYLAGLTVAALVLAMGINLVIGSVRKVIAPTPTEFGPAVVVVLLLSIAVKGWMAVFNRDVGRIISSTTLEATAADSRFDVIATTAVLASSVVTALTGVQLDGIVGAGVGAFICVSGFGLLREAIDPLLGRSPSPELIQHIHDKIMGYPGVLDTHDLMVHDYGPGRLFASAHVEMAAEQDVFAAHDLLDNIEQDFKDEGVIMTLHYDPIVTRDPQVRDMRNWISREVRKVDPRLTIHDLRTVPGPTHTNVIFDCLRPHDLEVSDDELKRRVCELVRSRYPDAVCKITIDEGYVSSKQ